MGLCPSRNRNITKPDVSFKDAAPSAQAAPQPTTLRATAAPYRPKERAVDNYEPQEQWEHFLAAKEKQKYRAPQGQGLRRRPDGTFTSGYTKLLEKSPKRVAPPRAPPPPPPGLTAPVEKKKKLTTLKKQILAQRGPEEDALQQKFQRQLERAQELQTLKAPAPTEALRRAADAPAMVGCDAVVPFGLSSRSYDSDTEDAQRSHRHLSAIAVPRRDYALTATLTPALEAAVTTFLFNLRAIKMQEITAGLKSRRYTVGFREVTRMMTQGRGKALLIAPDMEASPALEQKVATMVEACKKNNIPVVYALSRRQFGQAIQKNVSISVLGVEDVRGAEKHYDAMLAAM